MSNEHDSTGTAGDQHEPSAPVEVWCASLNRWVDGFDLVDRTVEGCLIRRLSDGELLPLAFSDEHVRPVADADGARPGPLLPSTARTRA
mgnify:CR=1 FL=1